jgi:hypothetical protein|tara:strand:+ start:1334 stop:1636 length:303 start_codon:yes stop_codon:yes gene_type:complete
MLKVFVPNKSAHNFSDALRFGELVFLTSGTVNKYAINSLYRELSEGLQNSSEQDHLMISSLAILNSICSAIFARKHGKVNYLLFRDGKYISRTIDIDALI